MKRYANLQALCGQDLGQERANSQFVPHPSAVYTSSFVNKTWCTNCTLYTRADKPTARVPKKALGKISVERGIHCCPNFVWFLLPDQRLYIVKNMCVYIHISDCVETLYELPLLPNNTVVKQFYTNRSGAKCWLDINRWGAGLAVTGPIRDTGQNVLQASFEAGSSSSSSSLVTATISYLSHSSRRSSLETWCNNYTMH